MIQKDRDQKNSFEQLVTDKKRDVETTFPKNHILEQVSVYITILLRWAGAFNKLHWFLRYVLTVLSIYITGALAALNAGSLTYSGISKSHCCFINDYVFHYSWVFVIPVSLLIIPSAFRNIEVAIKRLKECDPPIINDKSNEGTAKRLWCIQVIVGVSIGIIVVAIVGAINCRSLAAKGKTDINWWFPREGSCLAFAYFLTICAIMSSIALIFIIRYLYAIRVIRKGVLSISELPTWVGSSEGPLDKLFRSVFLLCVPGSTISLMIIINRIIMDLAWDFVFIFNVFMIPFAFGIGLIFPVLYCGVSRKFLAQRSARIWELDKRIAELMKSSEEKSQNSGNDVLIDKDLFEELENAVRQREFIKKNYPILPLGSMTKIVSGIPIGISALPTIVAAVKMLAAKKF